MNPAQFVKISSLLLFRLVYAAPFGFIPLLQNFSPRGLRKNVWRVTAYEIQYVWQVEPFKKNVGSSSAADYTMCSLSSLCIRNYCDMDVST